MDDLLRIGELARATGLTVRTLHHYDAIGLLAPSERAYNGYRLYDAAAVERLYRIRALRALGLSLDEIRVVLDRRGEDPRQTVARHIERLDEQLELTATLRRRLVRIGDALARSEAPSQDDVLQAI